ncbi:MFS transporter [Embleya sp. NBC_00896]|uniref:MFS transporter n=1 Tax=Embleya sp. NBC_00896 TaxID=2975961 RepID=UPI0038633A9F|nr:MFS transporter [Embleya sp. NBC_00896]
MTTIANPAAERASSSRATRMLLVVVLTVQFTVALDMSVVNVALPDIGADLGFSAEGLPWVVNAYALTFGGLMMLGGRIGDIVGRRRTLVAGLTVFGLAGLFGGFAPTPGALIAARAVQGIGAAALAPVAFALITVTFPAGPARSRALGLWGATAAAGGAFGVLIGGLLTQSVGWEAVMLINVPIVVFALLVARRLPADQPAAGSAPGLDLAGALLVTTGATALVLGVVRAERQGWGSGTTLGTLAVAAALLVAFVLVELRTAEPLLRMRLLTHRPVLGANLFMMLLFSGQFAAFYFTSLYLQQVLGYGPAAAGVAFLPFSIGIAIGSVIATKTVARVGLGPLLALGGALTAVGFGWFGLAFDADGTFLRSILGPSMVASIGAGLCFVPLGTAAMSGVAPHEAGMAGGLINSSRQIGGSIGLAGLVTLSASVIADDGGDRAHALAHGYAVAIGAAGGLLAVAAVLALLLVPAGPRAGGG